MKTSTSGRVGQYAALLAYLVFLAFPFLWLVSTAFKSPGNWAVCTPPGSPGTPPSTASGRPSTNSPCCAPPETPCSPRSPPR